MGRLIPASLCTALPSCVISTTRLLSPAAAALVAALSYAPSSLAFDAPLGYRVGPQGFVVDLAAPPVDSLITRVRALRAQLLQDRRRTQDALGSTRFTRREAVLAVLLPGGLLYTAYQKGKAQQLRGDLARIEAQLSTFDRDLTALRAYLGGELVARAADKAPYPVQSIE